MKSQKSFFFVIAALFLALSIYPVSSALAQADTPEGPYYLVKSGDTLWDIATRFGVSMDDLQTANQLADPGQLVAGAPLVIPGLQGYVGQVDTYEVAYGETLQTLSRWYGVSEQTLVQLNRIVSPQQIYAGYALIVPVVAGSSLQGHADFGAGDTLLEQAVRLNENPWMLAGDNEARMSVVLPGMVLQTRNSTVGGASGASALPVAFGAVALDPLPLFQGKTVVVRVSAPAELVLSGVFVERNLNFFRDGDSFAALQGIHTQTEPGLYPFTLSGELPDGTSRFFSQMIVVNATDYIYDPPLTVDPATIDPAATGPETELWDSLAAPVTPEKRWDGIFNSPVPADLTNCWPSVFGNRRSYNGGAYDYFHGGLDFCGSVGTELYAAAAGQVTYTGLLTVHGNVVILDHGWGVYTAYAHLSQIYVQVGEVVQAGQLVGLGGDTGRTTGPHLHWEVWVGGVEVDPMDWLVRAFP